MRNVLEDTPSRPDEAESMAGPMREPPPDLPHDSWLRRRWWVLLLAVVLGGVFLALMVPSSTPDSGSSAFHLSHLADRETESLAALLVDVPGYRYQDATDFETRNALAHFDPEVVPALSLHSILDPEDVEVAFLQIWGFVPGTVPTSLTLDDASQLTLGQVTESTVGGHDVILSDYPEQPDSRYTYMWLSGDALIAADGPDKEQLTAWLMTYLSVLEKQS